VKDKSIKEPFDPKLGVGARVQDMALSPKYSISVYAGTGTADGKRGDHILIAPPYTTSKEEIETIADLIAKIIEEVFSTL
jgi:adenosylmethionine-8-amino-7-oxononanoate aminotransferase